MDSLRPILRGCASNNVHTLKAAEKQLDVFSRQTEFVPLLLGVVREGADDALMASICLKNHVRRLWPLSLENGGLPDADRELVKQQAPELMLACSVKPVQSQLSETIALISISDFPQEWPGLLPVLTSKFLTSNSLGLRVRASCLQMVDRVLERYRNAQRSNEVLSELKFHVLPHVEAASLSLLKAATTAVASWTAPPAAEEQPWMDILVDCFRIITSVTSVDLPEFYEDNAATLFEACAAVLAMKKPWLSGEQDGEMEGPLEVAQGEALCLMDLWAARYTEEFLPYLQVLVRLVAEQAGALSQQPFANHVACMQMQFLRNCVRVHLEPQHNPFDSSLLQAICRNIVVRNIVLTERDLEMAEDTPLEFARQSLEAGDDAARRSAAIELVRGMGVWYHKEVYAELAKYVQAMLESAASTPAPKKHTLKDGAIGLLIAIVMKAQTRQFGVTQVHEGVDLNNFLATHLAQDLRCTTSDSVLGTCAALKFISTFVNQLDKKLLLEVAPLLVAFQGASNPVVHTHAIFAFDRLLRARSVPTVIDGGGQVAMVEALVKSPRRFSRAELKTYVLATVQRLAVLQVEGPSENEFVPRCLVHCLLFLGPDSVSLLESVVSALHSSVQKQAQGSSNAAFSHYTFEALCTALKACRFVPAGVAKTQELLLPTLTGLVTADEHDFTPYALQVLGLLVAQATAASDMHAQLFDYLLQEQQWKKSAVSVAAVVKVLESFIANDAVFQPLVVSHLETLFQRYALCLGTRNVVYNDAGYDLGVALFHKVPVVNLLPYLQTPDKRRYFMEATLRKLNDMSAKRIPGTRRLAQQFSFLVGIFACRCPTPSLPELLAALNPTVPVFFFQKIFLPVLKDETDMYKKRVGLLAACRSLRALRDNTEIVNETLKVTEALLGISDEHKRREPTELDDVLPEETGGVVDGEEFKGSFNLLSSAAFRSWYLSEVEPAQLKAQVEAAMKTRLLP